MELANAMKSGVVGAVALNVIHESMKHVVTDAPHVDEIAKRGVQRYFLDPFGVRATETALYSMALFGDLLSNSLYYGAAVGAFGSNSSKAIWKRAWFFGLSAGVLAVILPPYMRLGQQPTQNFRKTAVLTVAWYLLGALAAATALKRLDRAH